jgi:hypothetical protein
VTRSPAAQRAAEHLIRRACRRLSEDTRDERCREWTAELPAILHDPGIRSAFLRSARALRYAAGVYRSSRHLPGTARTPVPDTRQPAIFPRPDGVIPAIAAVIAWFVLLGLARALPPAGPWGPLTLVSAFIPSILAVVAIVRFVRWYRRRSRRTPDP